jgi:hypothetical protein
MTRQRAWSAAWALWLVGTLGSFAWLEAAALRRRCHPTLSTTLRRWLGVHPRTGWRRLAFPAFIGFWTCLCVHLARP